MHDKLAYESDSFALITLKGEVVRPRYALPLGGAGPYYL